MLGSIISWIIAGIVIGALARLVVPGKQNISIAVTIVLGILGALIGGFLAHQIGVGDTKGFDWIEFAISVIVGAALVFGYTAIAARNSRV